MRILFKHEYININIPFWSQSQLLFNDLDPTRFFMLHKRGSHIYYLNAAIELATLSWTEIIRVSTLIILNYRNLVQYHVNAELLQPNLNLD